MMTLDSLPLEIIQIIFSHIPNIPTLEAFKVTSTCIYNVYLTFKGTIKWDVILNEINADVLPDALLVQDSAEFTIESHDDQSEFCERYKCLRSDTDLCEHWTRSDWIELAKIYEPVQYFTDAYIASLTENQIAEELETSTFRTSERSRISRALCRFQVYCNLFGAEEILQRPDEEIRRDMFFRKFAPWENEQFACIYEFLLRHLSIAFNDVAMHDIEYGERRVRYCDDERNFHKEYYLSLGLGFLVKVSKAKTYDDRYRLLNYTHPDEHFLFYALEQAAYDRRRGALLDDTHEQRVAISETAAFPDGDLGPLRAWEWAHADFPSYTVFSQFEQGNLRDRGYVFFDLDRLEEWDMFAQPFEDIKVRQGHGQEFEDMKRSWDVRSSIYERGGRGWWSDGDESRIRWI